ncbi:hypothetical protein BO94DRAFT_549537 [Aspergillus sclerotioniger CBS 115572]|uniref:Uncharacterized protein n=1 Tax=Aspergillus sclerotioniger CBS 115572 TaxID=1450535 RepID=A0A317VNV9_9EURO|nr:hypothetical protein BO94DRAFT_549537 [Aspergillus sclerotioniger CBS 115572]PWY75279.1 hypothetical protein BO94DRAFT_549537 [Aspergillus sclerotioniger CBS 115572]
MCSNFVDDVVAIISKSGVVKDITDDIKSKVTSWTDAGKRIDTFCQNIGSSAGHENSHLGNLFCLPDDCHDELWVTISQFNIRLLGVTGPDRDHETQRIIARDILEVQDRARLDNLAAKVFDVLWSKVNASINDIINKSPESVLGRNLQHTQSVRREKQTPGEVRELSTSIHSDELSPSCDPVVNDASLDSATTIHASATNASARPHVSPSRSYDNTANQLLDGFDQQDEQTSINNTDMDNGHDIIQPISPAQSLTPFNEQTHGNMGSMINVHDTFQPILQTRPFASFSEQNYENMETMVNVHDMFQPLLPIDNYGSIPGQASTHTNMVNVHDILQPILRGPVGEQVEAQSQTDITNIAGDINQPTIQAPASTLLNPWNNAMTITGVHDAFQTTASF